MAIVKIEKDWIETIKKKKKIFRPFSKGNG